MRKFQVVPTTINQPLTRIATPAGITYLKKSSIKSSVYLGSKYHAIDINGNAWLKKSDLKKSISADKEGKVKGKKKPGKLDKKPVTLNELPFTTGQISENLSTVGTDLPTKSEEISTKKQYKVKKSLVRNRIQAWCNTKKGTKHLYFFTVTFPKGMPDAKGFMILNTWFTSLRKQRLIQEYLWVAERQPTTGTIHFHIAVPHFMKIQHINGIMRKILLGYAVRKEIPFLPEKFAPGKYNGVDVAGHKHLGKFKVATNFALKTKRGSLANYLTKYVTKNNETFDQLAWHNSRGFSALFLSIALNKDSFQATQLHQKLNWKKKFENDFMIHVPWFGNAPPIFWEELSKVNNYFQSLN